MSVFTFGDFSRRGGHKSSQATSNFSGSGQRLGGGSNKPLGAGSGRSLGGISDQMVGSELQGESPSRPGNEAATDVDAELSAHSSEEWDDEVPDNFEESSEEEEEQARLEKPQMEEDASPFTGSDWFDENHDLVRNTDGVEESAQAQAVEGDEKFKEAGERHAKRFRAIAKRFHCDGVRDKRLMDDELTDILDWSRDDNGATFGLIEDPEGTYVRTAKHTFAPINGKGAVLERASRTNLNNGSFKVVKSKRV